MDQLNVEQLLKESLELLNEGGSGGRIQHLYEDYKMTFNEMRQIFRNVFSGKTILTEKCLSPDTKICLEHNGIKTIRDVVENQIQDNVMSLDENGEIVYRPIINWFNNGIKNEWLKIKLEDGTEIICTPEHKLFKPDNKSFENAESLKVGDYLTVFQ